MVLGIIVLIRTFLSWSLEVEITGKWPWQRAQSGRAGQQFRPDRPQLHEPQRHLHAGDRPVCG
ncbi:MAG: DUF1622 domain-containing protein [Rhodoferax sp.]